MGPSRLLIRPLGLATTTTPSKRAAAVSSRHIPLMCLGRSTGGRPISMTAAACAPGCVLPNTDKGVDLTFLLAQVARSMRKSLTEPKPWLWGFNLQMFLEKAIVDCRFFTLLAVAGSLLASVLCFVEGCFLMVASYLQYFRSISQILPDPGQVVVQLIEAIDMFLMGTAMLLFGMALHVMFVGQNNLKDKPPPSSAFSNNINLNKWMGVESAMEAKSKMGHAVIMILQIQVLDKLKGISVNSGADLACFAGVVFLSSASIFLLSRIALPRPTEAIG